MKKKFFASLLLVLVLIICPVFLTGCGDITHSIEEFDKLYSQMKVNEHTSQFFDSNDNVMVNFSSNIKVNEPTDKSYIFGDVYNFYLKSSSRLFSGVIKNQPNPSFVLRNFKQEEITNLYNNLEDVNNKMLAFSESKTVYEKTESHIYYKHLLNDYNNLINSLYNFNTTFANAYFGSVGKIDFSSGSFSDRNIKDFLAYQLMQTSKVSFKYELVPIKINNPLGEVQTYINSSTLINNFTTLARTLLLRIDNAKDLTTTGTNSTNVATIFTNIQNNTPKYNSECEKFLKAMQNFNAKAYQSSTNKQTYLEDCDALEKSSYNIIQNFIEGRYQANVQALTEVSSSIRI